MIYEKLSLQFDIGKLKNHLQTVIEKYPPVQQTAAFGGWSVLSSDGDYTDGWHQGHRLWKEENMQSREHFAKVLKESGIKLNTTFILPTQICTAYLKEVMEKIIQLQLQPCRARIIRLTAGGASTWHRDAPDEAYCVRLHIPIVTNEHCLFKIENDSAHLPADGSAYFLKVNRMHQVVNDGATDRYHLVMDIKDTAGISQHHKYEPKKV